MLFHDIAVSGVLNAVFIEFILIDAVVAETVLHGGVDNQFLSERVEHQSEVVALFHVEVAGASVGQVHKTVFLCPQ
jgi:hypothetical protein